MDNFDLEAHLKGVYSTFPEAPRQPVIGLTANYEGIDATLRDRYYKQVVKAGATPVIVPPVADTTVIINTLQHLDALILTGGGDHNPLWMGQEPQLGLHAINRERDLAELLTVRLAFNRQLPMLGICRGIQTLAIALGGKVEQDITATVKHSQDADREEPTHTVTLVKGSTLYNIYGCDRLAVNSFHHQAVSEPGRHFRTIAKSADGIIEAMESSEYKDILGIQWHPEWLGDEGQKIFGWLADRAREYSRAKELHSRILTLDTHCDTPMFFPQGVDFGQRDPRILVDLHKMDDGHQDVTTMVAYLPQPHEGETFRSCVAFDVETPTAYADLIFDKIEDIVAHNSSSLALARTPADLYANKRAGMKSIMLGIENGLALGHDLRNVEHFAQRGIVYITLCHNGDNDICDSARGCNTHGGVSQYGEEVIREMNRLGIMVDLSHGGEKSFYDALEISRTPIVCSHSSCRALCDVPRNLTDAQMRALAAKGGVAHTTLYHGFLCREGEAGILDALEHLEHAISVMGIEHVGLGTDFDGDGGIRGLADSSEMIQFTLHLLRRRYSEQDIARIWGGNWLRVMEQVQAVQR